MSDKEDDDDNTPVFDNEPISEEHVEKPKLKRSRTVAASESSDNAQQCDQVVVEKSKRQRSRATTTSAAFDPNTDPTCVAILAFLNSEHALTITRASTIELDGKSIAVGTKMYTLRLQARDAGQCTPLVTQRLAHLSQNERWTEFMNNTANSRPKKTQAVVATRPISVQPEEAEAENEEDTNEKSCIVNDVTQTKNVARVHDLEKDVAQLAYQCLRSIYHIERRKEQHSQFLLTLYKCFPNMQAPITRYMLNIHGQRAITV